MLAKSEVPGRLHGTNRNQTDAIVVLLPVATLLVAFSSTQS